MYTKESIRTLLETSDLAVERGLLALYDRQTVDEQSMEATCHRNGVGFSAFDAEFLSGLAVQIQKRLDAGNRPGCCLSSKQLLCARKKILRYAGQLAEIANSKVQEAA
jgi:hypothetical protein